MNISLKCSILDFGAYDIIKHAVKSYIKNHGIDIRFCKEILNYETINFGFEKWDP